MIGAKVLLSVLLFGGTAAVVITMGAVDPTRLMGMAAEPIFWIGCFAAVGGTLIYRLGRLGEDSRDYFRLSRDPGTWHDEAHFLGTDRLRLTTGHNTGEAFDLPPAAQWALSVGTALLLGFATLDARAVDTVARLPETLTAQSSEFCPDATEPEADDGDPNAPGCALVLRAYALGYADSVGDCGKKKRGAAAAVCHLRQQDEPALHYTWRLLARGYQGARALLSKKYWRRERHDFETRTRQADVLLAAQVQIMTATPRASHHIWTNLPDPDDGAFDPETCLQRYREVERVALGAAAPTASKVFEHAVAQLVFEGRYEPAAGSCQEYQVHWGAALDTCARLATDPEAVLIASGAGEHLAAARQRQQASLAASRVVSSVDPPHLLINNFLSFQCYFEEERARPRRTGYRMLLDADTYRVTEVRAPRRQADALHVAQLKNVASMLSPGFHYQGLMSEAGIESPDVAVALSRSFGGSDFPLSRLQTLSGLDVFLAPEAIAARPDLLAIYPYHLHLRNFIRVFRSHYGRQVSRL